MRSNFVVINVQTSGSSSGFYIQEPLTNDTSKSTGLFVFTSSKTVLSAINVGDSISLSGRVQEFRPAANPTYLTATELSSPTNVTVLSHNNTVMPVVLGQDRAPPTRYFSSLDQGQDGYLSVPNNQTDLDVANPNAQPDKYGVDFWSSLEGQLVIVPQPVSLNFGNSFGEFWVRGNWTANNVNSRGGLTLGFGPDGIPDGGPESIIIGSPVDGTKNPSVSVGKALSDITGVVQYQFGFYYILPLTAPIVLSTPDPTVPSTKLTPSSDGCTITIGDYNVNNFDPKSNHLSSVGNHIANFLASPDVMFLQEIQDNSGETDDGMVDGGTTLTNLVTSVSNQGGIMYNFTEINPQNDMDGGVPGGNIRVAYLFNPKKVSLVPGSPVGGTLDAVKPVRGGLFGFGVGLNFNPGRIDPTNTAWNSSRKPLVAHWQTNSGHKFYTINIHDASKSGGGSSIQGAPRPPINSDVDQRTAQVEVIANFVKSLLKLDPLANIVVAGDWNEFIQTRSVFEAFRGILFEVDDLARIPAAERYTYVFDNLNEQLDHVFVSPAMALRRVEAEHIHVNSWASNSSARASDHDPSVARLKICGL
ncbi:DNase I-like protein [Irpex rosettiformis]|uniref:DNase I-like protein n=1 Tax=Irpex rosettiformis TaxID=378272 RepID=A0ACB8U0M0_9APHY|nr:DNase I-like protein [Irpex rosettiformis]